MPNWLLITEISILALAVLLALPVWAIIPMFFGVTPETPPPAAMRVYIALLAFPLVAALAMYVAFQLDAADMRRWLLASTPPLYLLVLRALS